MFRTLLPGGSSSDQATGYWLIQASSSAVQSVYSPSTLTAGLTSDGYAAACPSGDLLLTNGKASVGLESPNTAAYPQTYNPNGETSVNVSHTFCLPASQADVRAFSVTGSPANAYFTTPIPYLYNGAPAPAVDYAYRTISAAGIKYTVFAGSSYVIASGGATCGTNDIVGTAAAYVGVQSGDPGPISIPYVLGQDNYTPCDVSALTVNPR